MQTCVLEEMFFGTQNSIVTDIFLLVDYMVKIKVMLYYYTPNYLYLCHQVLALMIRVPKTSVTTYY